MRKFSMSVLLVMITMLVLMTACGKEKEEYPDQQDQQQEQDEGKRINVGDVVEFGVYEQDNNSSNGKEAIQWIVLDKKDDKVLLFSKYCLNLREYNASVNRTGVWERSDIREWLNGDFMDSAFTMDEMEVISYQPLINADSEQYGTNGGEKTIDQVFLLSENEITQYFPNKEDRRALPTAYAKAQTKYSLIGVTGYCVYWLRSPGKDASYPMAIDYFGNLSGELYLAHNDGAGVRPAIWVYYSEGK